jgi:superfamily II DNA/RNA helicase
MRDSARTQGRSDRLDTLLHAQVLADAQLLVRGSHLRVAAVHGGSSVAEQVLALRGRRKRSAGGCDLLVATPGRLLQLVERRVVRLGRLASLVVDEADRLTELGMWPEVRALVRPGPGHPCHGRHSAVHRSRDRVRAWTLMSPPRALPPADVARGPAHGAADAHGGRHAAVRGQRRA